MTLDANRQKELDEVWMDSLLREALASDSNREQERIQTLLANPAFALPETNTALKGRFGSWTRWLPLALAASIALLFGYWATTTSSDQRAYAAIARGMQPIPLAREYVIQIVSKSADGEQQSKTAQLFLDSGNQFVVHRRGWLGFGDVWFGKEGNKHWVVPRLGPAIVGSEGVLAGWMTKKDSTAPYLHLEAVLKRMEKGYALAMLPDASLEGVNGMVTCERVRGERKKDIKRPSESELPKTIELWADRATGIVHRLTIVWERSENEAGPFQWTIELKGFPTLSDDWFKPMGHTAPGQRIVTIGKGSDIDTLPKE